MSGRKSLSYAQRREIDLYLGTVVKKFGEGLCEYLEGHSDQTVAAKFDCTVNNVSGVREAVYGHLRPPVVRSPLEDRVEALEERVRNLSAVVGELLSIVHKDQPTQNVLDLGLKAAG